MLLLLFIRSVDSVNACIYAEIRTRIPDMVSWDYNFEPAGSTPLSFTVKVLAFNFISTQGQTNYIDPDGIERILCQFQEVSPYSINSLWSRL